MDRAEQFFPHDLAVTISAYGMQADTVGGGYGRRRGLAANFL